MTMTTMSRTKLSRSRVIIDLADGRTRAEDFRAHGSDALISKRQTAWTG